MMERLTCEGNYCDIVKCKKSCPLYKRPCAQKLRWERLKAYEDMHGLMSDREVLCEYVSQEEVLAELTKCDVAFQNVLNEYGADGKIWFDKQFIAKYVGLLKYIASKKTIGDMDAARLRELAEADKDGRLVVLPCKVGDTVYMLYRAVDGTRGVREAELWWTDIPQLGETVFPTREEAERALEGRQ